MKRALSLLLILPVLAHAECHFKISGAPVCTSGSVAAAAYARYGMDTKALGADYNRALLHQSGCSLPYYGGPGKNRIKLVQAGRVPTSNGWIAVDSISVNDSDLWYVAASYLEGTCEAFHPSVTTAPFTGRDP